MVLIMQDILNFDPTIISTKESVEDKMTGRPTDSVKFRCVLFCSIVNVIYLSSEIMSNSSVKLRNYQLYLQIIICYIWQQRTNPEKITGASQNRKIKWGLLVEKRPRRFCTHGKNWMSQDSVTSRSRGTPQASNRCYATNKGYFVSMSLDLMRTIDLGC